MAKLFLENKIISQKKFNLILNSLDTITSTYLKFSKSEKNNSDFLNLFYHLRPGTYDITIKRQNTKILPRKINNLELILDFKKKKDYLFNHSEKKKIDVLLKKNQFSIKSEELINYISCSIKLRENSKFIFTRSISDLLEIVKFNAKKKKISLIDLQTIMKLIMC